MSPLKGLACVCVLAVAAAAAPAYAQSGGAPSSGPSTISPDGSSAGQSNQQNSGKMRRHHRRKPQAPAGQPSQPSGSQQ
jgi:hypothetical protein